jgi:hypothetical protein
MRRHYYRCSDCLVPMVMEHGISSGNPLPACACGGKLRYIGIVRRHRVVRLEDHAVCDARCTNAPGPNCNCRCGGEHHGSGRIVTVVAADLGPAIATALDPEQQITRATEYRAAKAELDAAVLSCRLAWAFADRRAGAYIADGSAYLETSHVHERRVHAIGLKSHSGRIRALKSLTEYVRKL